MASFKKTFLQWRIALDFHSGFFLSLYLSLAMIFYSAQAEINRLLIDSVRFLPLHNELLGVLLPAKKGRVLLEHYGENHTMPFK